MRRPLAASVLLLLLVSPLEGQTISNRDLFGKTVTAAHEALEHYGRYDEPEALARVARIGYRLAGNSGFTGFPFTFYLVDMREPNAFALPGGEVFVTRGMLDQDLSDDQLAGLLGHEIAHVVLSHGMKMEKRANVLNALGKALLVGIILASDNNSTPRDVPYYARGPRPVTQGEKIAGAAAASLVLPELLLRSYSREFEDQADEEGQRIAAAAGYDPDGARQLFALLDSRLPQSKDYGYWRTHPFFVDRVDAAGARGHLLKVQSPQPVDRYRNATQALLLDYARKEKVEESVQLFLERAALTAWPQGEVAERLRLQRLHRARDAELDKAELLRDYGKVIDLYEKEAKEVAALTPDSPFLRELEGERDVLADAARDKYPNAVRLLQSGVYQTEFLESFVSNYPEAPEASRASLALAEAYSRLGRETEAVSQYLRAWRSDSGGAIAQRVVEGLRRSAPALDRLAALEQIADQVDDPDLRQLTSRRLGDLATSYRTLDNGAEYLDRFPEGDYATQVEARLDDVAESLYGEVVLYQAVGDSIKALERIQKILTYAPFSPAADRLRERAVLDS
jgi:predicted Zn-dependent protease